MPCGGLCNNLRGAEGINRCDVSGTNEHGRCCGRMNRERAAPRGERNGMEEHRTEGGADGMKWMRTWRGVCFN